ncbi:MAG: hypothetical protein NT034_00630 [Candidatus Magasanikbacteria bacterium]|nr:hypothetical protein [Candidatus Magasanikbacteria bacterium]
MTVPPHIPAPSCNISNHKRWESIKNLLSAVIFGLFAGLTGAAIMLGWIWPNVGGSDSWVGVSDNSGGTHGALSDNIRSESEDRLGEVYRDVSVNAGLNFLSKDKKIGEAVFISSDGWMALYYPNFDGNFKNWKVLLKNGTYMGVQKALHDSYSNLVYLKVTAPSAGAQFKVANFNDQIKSGQDLFVRTSLNWRHTFFNDYATQSFVFPHLDTAPSIAIKLNDSFEGGSWVVDSSGKFIGVISSGNAVLPTGYITTILPSVLSGQKITYRTLGVTGWFSLEQPIIVGAQERLNGFAVSKIISAKELKAGDVITTVNGQLVSPDNLWYNIVNNQSVKLQVWRKGKLIELVEATKQI